MSSFRTYSLDHIFDAKTVAVIGASETEDSVGRALMVNLLNSSFDGQIFPVNLRRKSVLGLAAVARIQDVPAPVDLAIIATPANSVAKVVEECADADVKSAVIISAGFRETGITGKRLENRVLEAVRQSHMRIIGPNCLGIMNPFKGLNATFAPNLVRPGNVALISQSGAILSAMLDWAIQENAGFSKVVSIGAMLDVDWSDMLYYLGDDRRTRSIVIYMESMGDPRPFLSAAREVARRKPIVVFKAGRTKETAQAVVSHTGSSTGDDAIIDAAFRRCGVLRVDRIAELFYMAGVLSKQPRPRGSNLTIVTNAGGLGVLATDALIAGGGRPTELASETIAALDNVLPSHWSRGNPIDILGDATPERFAQSVKIAANDKSTNGLLVILTPQNMTAPTQTAEAVRDAVAGLKKPVLTSWMGGAEIASGESILNQAEIPTLAYPDAAARVFNYMARYARTLERLYETPTTVIDDVNRNERIETVQAIIDAAQQKGRTVLTELESKQILAAYGLSVHPAKLAKSDDEAAVAAEAIGFPVLVKLHSTSLVDLNADDAIDDLDLSEIDGIWRNLGTIESVRQAFRAIRATVSIHAGEEHFHGVTVHPEKRPRGVKVYVGSDHDAQFGPVLRLGASYRGELGLGDTYMDDAIYDLPPLTTTLARHLMARYIRTRGTLRAYWEAEEEAAFTLAELLVRFSHMVSEQRRIRLVNVDPVVWSQKEAYVLDAQITLHDPILKDSELTRPAIRPYPSQYIEPWTLNDGTEVMIRPIRPEDELAMAAFNKTLSQDTIYLRYFYTISVSQLTDHGRLARFCFIDYDLEMTLVVEKEAVERSRAVERSGEVAEGRGSGLVEEEGKELPVDGEQSAIENEPLESGRAKEIIAVGQLVRLHDRNEAEFALLIGDAYQRQGLGTELLGRLLDIARDEEMDAVIASILPQNTGMRKICEKFGFTFSNDPESGGLLARVEL